MLKMLRYMKKSALSIVAIVLLLFLQAMCDLSLPDYTSNIVNVGIQQGGIENAAPEVIPAKDLDTLKLFMKTEDREFVESFYTLTSKGEITKEDYDKLVKKYPGLKELDSYVIKKTNTDEIARLNSILSKPELIVYKMKSGEAGSGMPEGIDAGSLALLTGEERDKSLSRIDEKFAAMPDSIIEQTAVVYVNEIYTALGANMEEMQTNYIWVAGLKMLGVSLVGVAASILVGLLSARAAALLGLTLRGKVFNRVVAFSNSEFDKFSTASLITRSTNDIQQVQMTMVMMLRMVIYAPIMAVGGIIKVMQSNVDMLWIVALIVAVVLSVMGTLFVVAMPRFKKVQQLIDKLNLVSREILTGLPVIRAFSTEKHEEKRFDEANTNLTKTNLFVNRVMTVMMPTMMFIMNAATVLIVWVGAENINTGAMQVGDLMAYIQYTMQIIMSFIMISMMSIMLPRASVSANRIIDVIDTKETIHDPKKSESFDDSKKGVLEFRDVSFRYPQAEEDVLANISFTAKPGETTAIIGSTGSGKSTLVNLIPRFYDVTSGKVLIDGVDVRDVTQHELRDRLGFVPQKGVLFSGTIESNIKYGAPNANDEDMKKAAEIAQASDFIEASEDGYEREISQGGTNVSGGQKQRLSIARAIAKKPEIFVFDDSFSALDYKTDVALRRALKQATKDSTVIIIAQRISTILHAEQIIVLDEGRVAGIGTHKELLQDCEVYKQIATSQLSKEELEQ